jgi:hypothetical protein
MPGENEPVIQLTEKDLQKLIASLTQVAMDSAQKTARIGAALALENFADGLGQPGVVQAPPPLQLLVENVIKEIADKARQAAAAFRAS